MSISLEPALQSKLDRMARLLGKPADDIATEAIHAYLEELDARTLAVEEQAYRRLYPQLKERYLGLFVAIHNGEVVDTDPDFEPLFLRVQERLGDRPVLMRRVGDTPAEEYRFLSPRLERSDEGPRILGTAIK